MPRLAGLAAGLLLASLLHSTTGQSRNKTAPSLLRNISNISNISNICTTSSFHRTTGQSQSRREQCCSEDAINCAVACTGCTPCYMCIGIQAFFPWCWGCAFCLPCLSNCHAYLDCYGHAISAPSIARTPSCGARPRVHAAGSWELSPAASRRARSYW